MIMAADFAALEAEVSRNTDVSNSAIALLNGIAARVQAAVDADNLADNTETAKLAADLSAQVDALSAAVTANT
jgi:hypothetical protein